MTKRLFIAIDIKPDRDTLNHIHRIQNRLSDEAIKWVDTSGIHLTLKFLGETDEALIPEIEEKLRQIASTHKSTRLEMRSMGVFPNPQRPRVIWLGMTSDGILSDLVKRIDNRMQELGYQPEEREFKPHITLGRVKFLKNRKNLQKLLDTYSQTYFQDIPVDEIILYESQLTPKGARYTALARFKLQ